jgi:hypothetical protein
MARNSPLDSSALDITTATSQLVALTKEGAVDPEVTLAILLELRAQLCTFRQLLQTRPVASERPRELQNTSDL